LLKPKPDDKLDGLSKDVTAQEILEKVTDG